MRNRKLYSLLLDPCLIPLNSQDKPDDKGSFLLSELYFALLYFASDKMTISHFDKLPERY